MHIDYSGALRARFLLVIGALVAAGVVVGVPSGTLAAAPPYTVTTLHFEVHVGPTGSKSCDVVGDLYLPADASATHRVPAILATNGFGGSKDDLASSAEQFASEDYAFLAYSGLGFGGSGCQITLDDPDYDGKAASQLVSYLGGTSGIAFTDAAHTTPAPALQVVEQDAVDHAGVARQDDPRVGMIGGSYGGEVQFAAASIDPRIDTIVPMITWNDLSYSLAPNNTTQAGGVSSTTPGAVKLVWAAAFSAEGAVIDGLEGLASDPSRIAPCPNFATWVCPALVTAGTTGYLQPGDIAHLRHASVSSYMKSITVPVLLIQGEHDTLFNLNEAAATYSALKAQGTPVKMIWQPNGHSDATVPPSAGTYENDRIDAWFGHYLADRPTATGPAFAYFRDWVGSDGYTTAPAYPVGTRRSWYLGSKQSLVTSPTATGTGRQSFVTPAAGAPTVLDSPDVVGSYFSGANALQGQTLPGTSASWSTAPLAGAATVVGAPVLQVKVSDPAAALTQATGPAGELVLFAKVVDIDASGTQHQIDGEIAPVRVPDVNWPFTVNLPAIVHRFPAGDRIGLVIAGGSDNYRGNLTPSTVTVAAGGGQVLSMPIVNGAVD